jgi:hypothetical protein
MTALIVLAIVVALVIIRLFLPASTPPIRRREKVNQGRALPRLKRCISGEMTNGFWKDPKM